MIHGNLTVYLLPFSAALFSNRILNGPRMKAFPVDLLEMKWIISPIELLFHCWLPFSAATSIAFHLAIARKVHTKETAINRKRKPFLAACLSLVFCGRNDFSEQFSTFTRWSRAIPGCDQRGYWVPNTENAILATFIKGQTHQNPLLVLVWVSCLHNTENLAPKWSWCVLSKKVGLSQAFLSLNFPMDPQERENWIQWSILHQVAEYIFSIWVSFGQAATILDFPWIHGREKIGFNGVSCIK